MIYPRRDRDGGSFAPVSAEPDLPALERAVLEFWDRDKTFWASMENRRYRPEWIFYDGPPFANGLPHFGHLLTGYVKDVFPRYQTMRGRLVPRVFGWDTHGLPAELEAMKQLGLSEKADIEAMGVGEFNAAAKKSVLQYAREWEDCVRRQARWVDFVGGYKTLDIDYMESVIWAFKELHKRGLIYEGYRVLPYCWRDETPLSNHELRMDDEVYRRRQDQSLTVCFELSGERARQLGLCGALALAWTTTPWTLPTNLALAVNGEISYVLARAGEGPFSGKNFLLAKDLLPSYVKELGWTSPEQARAVVQREFRGKELVGLRYEPLFDFYRDADRYATQNAWQILAADYVSVSEGTGIVHQAPAYGEEDQITCSGAGIPTLISIDEAARFLPEINPYAGLQVFEANKPITRDLKKRGLIFSEVSYEHAYPHCYRCKAPLIYRAVSSRYVNVSAIKTRLLELAEQINWEPANVKYGQFGKWLEGARDWSISRNRFWGTPIPVWESDDPACPRTDVYGSIAELEADFGVKIGDLHRPAIDKLTRPNPDDPTGKSIMRRIPDVLDVWFDSASMSFAQVHYPFENQQWFASHSPADFIVEYIGQTRGWFYVMHVLSVGLFDRPAFKNVICHGVILGDDGQKASKSLRNYPDVYEVFDELGSDSVRWYLLRSPILHGGSLSVSRDGIRDALRQYVLPLWNSWYFLALYANAANYLPRLEFKPKAILDRYILAKLGQLVERVTRALDDLDATLAAELLQDFVEILTNWYIRRSRDRFWAGADSVLGRQAFDVLYTVLEALLRLSAPLIPLLSESLWKAISGCRSVHLTDWPGPEDFEQDQGLIETMDLVRQICWAGLSLRKQLGFRVRQPLAQARVLALGSQALAEYVSLIAAELNVKEVEIQEYCPKNLGEGLVRRLVVDPRSVGPRLGSRVQSVLAQARAGQWREVSDRVEVGGVTLEPGEFSIRLEVAGDNLQLLPEGRGCLSLDARLDEKLLAEGLARDAVRQVQEARRRAGLLVSDRINLSLGVDSVKTARALESFSDLLAGETLAVSLSISSDETADIPLSEGFIAINLSRA